MKQSNLIRKGDWNYLIVLDACRYDYFKDCYKDYLGGELSKAVSPVSPGDDFATADWCKKLFGKGFEDVVYISSTPIINSMTEVHGFDGKKHFGKILDVWSSGWDEEVGSVPPENINKATLEELARNGKRRMIIHYIQPHTPYLNFSGPRNTRIQDPEFNNDIRYKIFLKLASRIRKTLGSKKTRILSEFFGIPPINHLDYILRNYGDGALKEAYRDNLCLVLEEVGKLVGELQGNIAVTSDHGEMLGEDNYYGHSYLPPHPALNEVPWLEINR